MNRSCSRGFTLLELIVTVAVIAILGMIGVMGYQQYAARSRAADIVVKYDAIRSGVGAEIAQGAAANCADVVQRLGTANLADEYARLGYGFEAVPGGYRPVLTVCAKTDKHGSAGVEVARGAHDTLAKTAKVEKGAVLTGTLVSFAVPLTDSGKPVCSVPLASPMTACGDPAPVQAAASVSCLPHQHYAANQQRCNDVCNPGFYYVEGPPARCSSTPPAAAQVVAPPTPAPAQAAASNGCPPGKEPYTYSPSAGASVRTCVDSCGPGQVRDPNNFRWCTQAPAAAPVVAPPTPTLTAPSQVAPPPIQQRPPQKGGPPPITVVAPKLIDLGWYADLTLLTSDQLLQWMAKYMYPDTNTQRIASAYPTLDSRQKIALGFQTKFTPAIPPQAIPAPIPVKIPPLSSQQQSAVDGMSRDQLVDWAIQNLYQGNENLRTFVQRMSDQQLRQAVRDAQQPR